MIYFIISSIGYFIGCIHGSTFANKLSGVNLKKVGSGNAGASNATLQLGWKYGVLVALIDIAKAIIAILVLRYILNSWYITSEQIYDYLYLLAFAVIIGHNFPFHMNFKGGKGTASVIGAFIAIDWQMGLLALALFIVISITSNYLIIGLLAFYSVLLSVSCSYGTLPTLLTVLLFFITFCLHIPNIKNVVANTEPKVRQAFRRH